MRREDGEAGEEVRSVEKEEQACWEEKDMEPLWMWEGGEERRNEINNERLHNRNLIRTAGPYIAPD